MKRTYFDTTTVSRDKRSFARRKAGKNAAKKARRIAGNQPKPLARGKRWSVGLGIYAEIKYGSQIGRQVTHGRIGPMAMLRIPR